MSENIDCLTMCNVSYQIRGHSLIDDVSLCSSAHACTALLGANGAGKSTFLRLCHGLLTPTAGSVHWGMQSPAAMKNRITMVFQKPCLLKRTAYDNVKYALTVHQTPSDERAYWIETALQMVNLTHHAQHQARWLSGGEQRRLAIARAWVLQPDIILLDEPTAGLDIASSQAVEDIILDLGQQHIKTIIASHDLAQVRRLCDEVVFLDHGRVIQQSSTREFFASPKADIICDFIRSQSFS